MASTDSQCTIVETLCCFSFIDKKSTKKTKTKMKKMKEEENVFWIPKEIVEIIVMELLVQGTLALSPTEFNVSSGHDKNSKCSIQ
jgi:hypothetical protein